MIILLYSILLGSSAALILCAPYSYYPFLFMLLTAAILVFIYIRKYIKYTNKFIIIPALGLIAVSYCLCAYLIFKPSKLNIGGNITPNEHKKAIIFYCQGEMEKYTPYYSAYFMKDVILPYKPIAAHKIKRAYKEIGVNEKNKDLSNVAASVKNSILQNGPYYFYIAFSEYVPNFYDSMQQALLDGCSSVTVINYSPDVELEAKLLKQIDINYLNEHNIKVKFTDSICTTQEFLNPLIERVKAMPFKPDGILILDKNTQWAVSLKSSLCNLGYKDDEIITSEDISSSMDYFIRKGAKSVLYMDIRESGNGLMAEAVIPKLFLPYSDKLKITGIKSWGCENEYVKASIKVFLKAEDK